MMTAGSNRTTTTDDENIAATLQRIDRRLARLEDALAQAPGLVALATDTVDSVVARLADAGVDLDERGRDVLRTVERLTSPGALEVLRLLLDRIDALRDLVESGLLDREPLAIVGSAGAALAEAGRAPPPPLGLWGAVRALSHPDVQRAVGFVVRVAERFGAALATDAPATKQLPPATP